MAIEALIKAGASVKAADKEGRTALMWAARGGNVVAIEALVKAGASVEAADKDGKTALDFAKALSQTPQGGHKSAALVELLSSYLTKPVAEEGEDRDRGE